MGDTHLKKGWRTKRRTRDLDQIDTDLGEGKVEKLLAQEVDFDKAGLGQFYCVHCAKDFINPKAFQDHVKGKPHKRRLHALKLILTPSRRPIEPPGWGVSSCRERGK